ncbi:hypothetical protein amb4490 [Paramagnetospirillum magneticum AMB-1]|uniref:Lipoprotein n=2 Tax=Paramagnetospirillum magneticum TaxID=84159 RepID=Q2VYN1_PARM1|nr:hypothetical protein amb4490 [Paramagnetospirillum magneticum AMB-1]
MMRTILILALVLGVAACGRKGMPDRPDDAVYPRDYPYTPLPSESKARKDAGTPDLNTKAGY